MRDKPFFWMEPHYVNLVEISDLLRLNNNSVIQTSLGMSRAQNGVLISHLVARGYFTSAHHTLEELLCTYMCHPKEPRPQRLDNFQENFGTEHTRPGVSGRERRLRST